MKTQKEKTKKASNRYLRLDTAKLLKLAGIEEIGREYFFYGEWIPNSRGASIPYLFSEARKLTTEQWQEDLLLACKESLEVSE